MRETVLIAEDIILMFFAFIIPFILYKKNLLKDWSKKKTQYCILFWILFWTLEYWFLGPYSHIHFYDEADGALIRYLHDSKFHLGGDFLHSIQGGADYLSQQLTGGQYFSLERFIFSSFPLWISILIHKTLLVSSSSIGAYLFLRKGLQKERSEAFCMSAFFSVINPYMTYSTIHHGLGYAILPLALYIFTLRTDRRYYLLGCTLTSILISSSTVPTHSFLSTFIGIVLISFFLFRSKVKVKILLALPISILFFVINWIDVIYAMKDYSSLSTRTLKAIAPSNVRESLLGSIPYLTGKTELFLVKYSFSPFIILVFVVSLITFYQKRKKVLPLFAVIFLILFLSSLIPLIPWDLISMGPVKSINFTRVGWAVIFPLIVMASLYPLQFGHKKINAWIPLFLFIALLHNFDRKSSALKETLLANQKSIHSIENLNDQKWKPKSEYFRVVTAGSSYQQGFHPNFALNYGLDTLDGYTNLVPQIQTNYWYYGLHKNSKTEEIPLIQSGNLYLHYATKNLFTKPLDLKEQIDLEDNLDTNLLRLMNVSHILSTTPIKDMNSLSLVSSPKEKKVTPFSLREKIKQRINQLAKPKSLYIYKFESFTPRAYIPQKIYHLNETNKIDLHYRNISKKYCSTCAYSFDPSLPLGTAIIQSIKKTKEGYELSIDAQSKSTLVLNHFFNSYWKASRFTQIAQEERVSLFPINISQIGAIIPAGKYNIKFSYKRNRLTSLIFGKDESSK